MRISRGGYWATVGLYSRVTTRTAGKADFARYYGGFRLPAPCAAVSGGGTHARALRRDRGIRGHPSTASSSGAAHWTRRSAGRPAVTRWPGRADSRGRPRSSRRGRLLELGGAYGDREAADPAEYDHLRLVAGGRGQSIIEVFQIAVSRSWPEATNASDSLTAYPPSRRAGVAVLPTPRSLCPPPAVAEPVLRGSRTWFPPARTPSVVASICAHRSRLHEQLRRRATSALSRAARRAFLSAPSGVDRGPQPPPSGLRTDLATLPARPGRRRGWQGALLHDSSRPPGAAPGARRAALLRGSIADYDEALKRSSGAFSVLLGAARR